jgi:hypothetical protein
MQRIFTLQEVNLTKIILHEVKHNSHTLQGLKAYLPFYFYIRIFSLPTPVFLFHLLDCHFFPLNKYFGTHFLKFFSLEKNFKLYFPIFFRIWAIKTSNNAFQSFYTRTKMKDRKETREGKSQNLILVLVNQRVP